MDIKPTSVDAKDILILSPGSYGGEVTIQVVGYESATAPIRVPLERLKEFAQKVLAIDPLFSEGLQNLSVPSEAVFVEEAVS